MANIEHSTLTTTNLHENKGVSTATDNTVATAVTGATVWAKLTASNLTGTGNSFGAQLLHVRDEKASGTSGGSATSGSYVTRTLQTTKTNEISGASLAANQITLPAGTYRIDASAPAYNVDGHQAILLNVTDATTPVVGTAEHSFSSSGALTRSIVKGTFTIAGTKVFELRHHVTTSFASRGLGYETGYGNVEVYAEVQIWKIA